MKLIQNQPDLSPLTIRGHEFAAWIAHNLYGMSSDIVVSENVVRCIETMRPFLKANGCTVMMHDSSTSFKDANGWLDQANFIVLFLSVLTQALSNCDRVILCYRLESLDAIRLALGEKAFETLNVATNNLYSNIYTFICEENTWRHSHTESHPYGRIVS